MYIIISRVVIAYEWRAMLVGLVVVVVRWVCWCCCIVLLWLHWTSVSLLIAIVAQMCRVQKTPKHRATQNYLQLTECYTVHCLRSSKLDALGKLQCRDSVHITLFLDLQ